jgi:2,3-bisphosphoglycerate-independent phosphoglycerate mutase
VVDDFPRGPGSDWLNEMMSQSVEWFADHPVNQRREQNDQLPATNLWLWGLGKTPQLPAFEEMYGGRGSMITAVDLLRGIASLIGWECVEVPGATGYTDTDYAAKGRYAIETLSKTDLVCVHIEAPDEASHEGDLQAKIAALEAIDQYIVCPLITALESQGDYQILVSPDHPTPLRTKTHSHGFVPFTIAGTGIQPDEHKFYHERVASESSLSFEEGWRLMAYFTQKSIV